MHTSDLIGLTRPEHFGRIQTPCTREQTLPAKHFVDSR